ncbi:MAG: ThiF family adenylyltransferase [Nanoarchaeota archaeon]|nr:ThiF family adenylyltransferase [Nanoarchaeota archaeon]
MDYSKQTAVFDQAVLRNSSIAVIGNSNIASFFLLYAAGLGIGSITLFTGREKGFLDPMLASMINTDLEIAEINTEFEPDFIGKADIIADFTNSIESKQKTREYALRHSITYMSASSAAAKAGIAVEYPRSRLESMLNSLPPITGYEELQGSFTSGLIAAIAMDEARKSLLNLPGDERVSGALSINAKTIIAKHKPALVIGAGGIGTYLALNLALLGIPIEIYDGDNIEETNLNRQVLYYDAVGKNKALALKQKLESLIDARIQANGCFFEEKHAANKDYSAIFSCVDSWHARKLISRYALESNIPLVDAGVGAFTARLDVASNNTCLECRRGKIKLQQKKPESCASVAESNIVMCNALIGAVAAGFYSKEFLNPEKQLLYFSKKPIHEKISYLPVEAQCSCKKGEGCACHNQEAQ